MLTPHWTPVNASVFFDKVRNGELEACNQEGSRFIDASTPKFRLEGADHYPVYDFVDGKFYRCFATKFAAAGTLRPIRDGLHLCNAIELKMCAALSSIKKEPHTLTPEAISRLYNNIDNVTPQEFDAWILSLDLPGLTQYIASSYQ